MNHQVGTCAIQVCTSAEPGATKQKAQSTLRPAAIHLEPVSPEICLRMIEVQANTCCLLLKEPQEVHELGKVGSQGVTRLE